MTRVRARTQVTVRADGVLGQLRCQPPLTVRRVHADRPDICALCLVGTLAGPLSGDHLELNLHLEAGAHATLIAAGAAIAQGRNGDVSSSTAMLRMRARLDSGAELDADPGALIVCDGASLNVSVEIDLATDATVRWRELLVLGRSADAGHGAVTLRWDVTRDGRPLLRQFIDLADRDLRGWPGMTGGARVLATVLLSGPAVAARTVVLAPNAVAQRVDRQTVLLTVLGADAAAVRTRTTELLRLLDAPVTART